MQNLVGYDSKLCYKGGELIGIRSSLPSDLLECYAKLWKFNYDFYEQKQIKLNEEVHF